MHTQFSARPETPAQTAARVATLTGRAVYVVVRPACRRGARDQYVVTDTLFADELPLCTAAPDGTVTRHRWPVGQPSEHLRKLVAFATIRAHTPPDTDTMPQTTPAATQSISLRILAHMAEGMELSDAVDAVLGAGTYQSLASDIYDALRAK